MSLDPQSPREPGRGATRPLLALGLLMIGTLGSSAFREDSYFGRQWSVPFYAWLSGRFGPEGVPAGRHLVAWIFPLVSLLGALWLIRLVWQRLQVQPSLAVPLGSAPPSLRRPTPEGSRLVGPLVLVAIGILGAYLSSDGTWLGPDWGAPLLNGWLSGLFGPEGVHPGREFLMKLCFAPVAVGFLWLAFLYRTPLDPETRRAVEAWQGQSRTAVFFLLFGGATIAASLGGGGAVEIALCGGLTLLSGLSLARQIRRNRA